MQRTLTVVFLIILLAVGAAVVAGGATGGATTYPVPSDPVLAAVLIGAIIGILVLTLVLGLVLMRIFGAASSQLGVKLDADDRPDIEKKALGALDRFGAGLGKALGKVGYGQSDPAAPYTPAYSYKANPEQTETRQFAISLGVVLLLLVVYAIVTQSGKWAAELQTADKTLLGVAAGASVGLLVVTGALGAGLAFWFFRTLQEKDKAAQLKEPAWPAAQMVEMEQRIKNAPKTISEMTFLDKSLIVLNVGLVTVLLVAVAVWVVPGMFTVAAVDQALKPTVPPVGAASSVPADLQKEIDALPKGDAARGKTVFNTQICHTCHVDTQTGPAMPGDPAIGVRAATRRPGYSATAYLYESIVNPSAYIVKGYQDGLMPKDWKTKLKPQEIADLIAYLESMK